MSSPAETMLRVVAAHPARNEARLAFSWRQLDTIDEIADDLERLEPTGEPLHVLIDRLRLHVDALREHLPDSPVTLRYLTVKEAAEVARCHPMTVYRAVSDNELRHTGAGRLIRIRPEWVDEWLAHRARERATLRG